MDTAKNLTDINWERTEIIEKALKILHQRVERGVEYTPLELWRLTDKIISPTTFDQCLCRGWRAVEKRKAKGGASECYSLFNSWRGECIIKRYGPKVITVKEYDEDGNLIREYKRRKKGASAYTATFVNIDY